MTQAKTDVITLYAEQEHAGIRAAVVISMFVTYLLSFWLFNAVIRLLPPAIASYAILLSCVLAAPAAVGLTWLLERWLKTVWHSGYSITLQPDSFVIAQPAGGDVDFQFSGNVAVLAWYFKLIGYKRGGRERRVAKEWLCFCCQVQQDGSRFIAYTFAPPEQTAVYAPTHPLRFQKINPVEVYDTSYDGRFAPPARPVTIPSEIISGKNGRYWLAEQRRWTEGLELTREDFATFLQYLQTHNL